MEDQRGLAFGRGSVKSRLAADEVQFWYAIGAIVTRKSVFRTLQAFASYLRCKVTLRANYTFSSFHIRCMSDRACIAVKSPTSIVREPFRALIA
jgi:hypothetical protein